LNVTSLEKRRKIDVVVAVATVVGSTASVVIAANAGTDIYEYIAQKIKDKSDRNSCTLTYGTDSDDGSYEGYAFQATTTGSNCDTTAIYQTILNAVEGCANKLHNARSVRGCCKSSHGGTWTGHLRFDGRSRPVSRHYHQLLAGSCRSVTTLSLRCLQQCDD
jgi:hypothetical protein